MILTDTAGRTLYYYDRDTQGVSNCVSAGCLAAWPILAPPASGTITLQSGVTAKADAITRSDGPRQVTINGLPVYYYTPDQNPGDARGAGANGVWWTIRPDGTKMNISLVPTATPGGAAPTATSGAASPTATTGATSPTATTASGGGTPTARASNIQGFQLESFTVPVGTMVTWTNKDAASHTATANGGAFSSGNLSQNATYSFTFTQAGTYAYHCAIHSSMTGTVTVQ
jgi:plastocyanin/predicted lipoprotein with Yx(FWY)xxD motif